MPIAVQVPKTPTQLDQVRALMRSFIAWHKERHREDIDLINASHLATLRLRRSLLRCLASTGPPRGQLLLATLNDAPAGCVALREIDSGSCEMKRMFVYKQHHGKGVGRALGEAIIKEARCSRLSSHAIGHERSPGGGQRTLPTAGLPDYQALL